MQWERLTRISSLTVTHLRLGAVEGFWVKSQGMEIEFCLEISRGGVTFSVNFSGGGNSILPGNSKTRGVTFSVNFQGVEVILPGNSKGCVCHILG